MGKVIRGDSMNDLILKQKLSSLYGACASGEYPAPRFTNNSRKMAGLPMFRKGKTRCRKFRGFRNPGAEALQALIEIWNADYIDTDSAYMVGGYHRGRKNET